MTSMKIFKNGKCQKCRQILFHYKNEKEFVKVVPCDCEERVKKILFLEFYSKENLLEFMCGRGGRSGQSAGEGVGTTDDTLNTNGTMNGTMNGTGIATDGIHNLEDESGQCSGKLYCLSCNHKLGHFDLSGTKCGCGKWIAPGIACLLSRLLSLFRFYSLLYLYCISCQLYHLFSSFTLSNRSICLF